MQGGRITSEEKSALSTYVGVIITVLLAAGGVYFFFLTEEEKKQTTGFDPNRAIPDDATLKYRLTPEQFRIVRGGGTQTPFQNEYWDNERTGIYVDVITGEPLFTSRDKYDARVGLPSFSKPIDKASIAEYADNSHDMQRTEVRARRSNAHLGHLFADNTSPTGQRYTINSAALRFIPIEQMKTAGYESYLPLLEQK